jgi:hypothetical protein
MVELIAVLCVLVNTVMAFIHVMSSGFYGWRLGSMLGRSDIFQPHSAYRDEYIKDIDEERAPLAPRIRNLILGVAFGASAGAMQYILKGLEREQIAMMSQTAALVWILVLASAPWVFAWGFPTPAGTPAPATESGAARPLSSDPSEPSA